MNTSSINRKVSRSILFALLICGATVGNRHVLAGDTGVFDNQATETIDVGYYRISPFPMGYYLLESDLEAGKSWSGLYDGTGHEWAYRGDLTGGTWQGLGSLNLVYWDYQLWIPADTGTFLNDSAETIYIGFYGGAYPYQYREFELLHPDESWSGQFTGLGSNWAYRAFSTGDQWVSIPDTVVTSDYTYTSSSNLCSKDASEITTDDTEYTEDPISTYNGDVSLQKTDIFIPCPGLSLEVSRQYHSQLDHEGLFGYRWISTYEWHLEQTSDGTNTYGIVYTDQGEDLQFLYTNGCYADPYDKAYHLEQLTNSTFKLTLPSATFYSFDTNGVLQSISDLSGNTLTLAYSNSYPLHLLTKVEHSNGQSLDLSYNGNRVSKIETPDMNFFVTYVYNGLGEVTNATTSISSNTLTDAYSYDATTNHSLMQRVNAAGHTFNYEYATNGSGAATSYGTKVYIQTNYYLHTVDHSTSNDNYTIVTYTQGDTNKWYEYYYSPYSRRIMAIYGPNTYNVSTRFAYNSIGEATSTEMLDGSERTITRRGYDAKHNVTNESFGYNVASSNFWRYSWDTNGHYSLLTQVEDPEGSRIALDYEEGLLAESKLYYSSNSYYSTTYGYTTNGLMSGVTNANGHWVNYYYDSYGNSTSVVPQEGPTMSLYRCATFDHGLRGWAWIVS